MGARSPHSPAVLVLFKHGLTLTEVAAARGVTHSAVSQWLSGKSSPPPDLLVTVEELSNAVGH